MRVRLIELEKLVTTKIKSAKATSERMHAEAATLGHAAAGSWSVGAERNFAEGQAAISAQNLAKLQKLHQEIIDSLDKTVGKIEPVCFVELELGGETIELYLVEHPVFMEHAKLISTASPLGAVILGKKVGSECELNGKPLKIQRVE